MRGVGASNPCTVTQNVFAFAEPAMVAPCGGTSIADDIATALHATAMQNLALGGAYVYDALTFEAPKIDPSATLVIVLIGLNDEKALADSIGSTTVTITGWYSTTPFLTQLGVIDAAISATGDAVADLGPANIYANANFVQSGCPNPGVGACQGHPNNTGAQLIAALIANAL
jgi:lysophospholipase L1-like esterase